MGNVGTGSAEQHSALHRVRDKRRNEQGRVLRTPALGLLIFPRLKGGIPTPPHAMTKLFDANCVTKRGRHLEKASALQ